MLIENTKIMQSAINNLKLFWQKKLNIYIYYDLIEYNIFNFSNKARFQTNAQLGAYF